jgi:hypothetical protein
MAEACQPKYDVVKLGDGKLEMKGWCDNLSCKDEDGCQPEFHCERKGAVNKNAKITAQGQGSSQANIEITADGDIENGVVTLVCTCGKTPSKPVEYKFSLDEPLGPLQVLKAIVTIGHFFGQLK